MNDDAEYAIHLRRHLDWVKQQPGIVPNREVALERAIELLEREATALRAPITESELALIRGDVLR